MKHISSHQNGDIKRLLALQSKTKIRKEKKLFVVEGQRELHLAQLGKFEIETIFWCAEIFEENHFETWRKQFSDNTEYIRVSLAVYKKIVVRDSTEGVVGILNQKETQLIDWQPRNKEPLVLVLEAIEKPGNLGAILRSADAAQIDAVLLTDSHTDIHNFNVIRSSVGGFFNIPIYVCTNDEARQFLEQENFEVYAATLQKSTKYTTQNYVKPTAFVLGSEAKGLSAFWYERGVTAVKIPMHGHVDSLNVSVASALLIYEAIRQRNS